MPLDKAAVLAALDELVPHVQTYVNVIATADSTEDEKNEALVAVIFDVVNVLIKALQA